MITAEQIEKLKKIKIVATDVDGVLTDGGMYYSKDGDVMKKFNARDGMSLKMMEQDGYKVALITGEENDMVLKRAEKLKIKDVFMFARDKIGSATELLDRYDLELENLLYIGDDWLDVELMQKAGFSCAPSDAMDWAVDAADYVCQRKGGTGVIAEIYSMLLKANK